MKTLSILTCLALFFSCTNNNSDNKKLTSENLLYDKAFDFYTDSQTDSAFIYFNNAKSVFASRNEGTGVGSCLMFMSIISTNTGDHFGGQELAVEALKYFDINNKNDFAYLKSIFNTLGDAYSNLKDYKQAIICFTKALSYAKDDPYENTIENNLANAYRDQKDYNMAIQIYKHTLSKTKPNSNDYARTITNDAVTRWLQNEKYNASVKLKEAYIIRKKNNDLRGQNSSYAHLADYYAREKPDSALYFAENMYQIAKIIKSPDDQVEALQKLIKLSPATASRAYFSRYQILQDSIQTARSIAKNQFAFIRYQTEKHKADNLVLQKENSEKNYQIALIITGSILLGVGGIFWYRKRKQRLALEAEKTIQENQLQTSKKVHDVVANGLYRVMTEIENVAELDREQLLDKIEDMYIKSRDISYNKPVVAAINAFHEKLAQLILSFKSNRVSISLIGNTADFWKGIADEKRHELEQVLQELLVNMNKHSHATHVALNFSKSANQATIIYKDNGIGLPDDVNFNNGLTSTGNRIKNIFGSITFESIENGGLEILISFPVH